VGFRLIVDDTALDAARHGGIRVDFVGGGTKLERAASVLVHVVGDVQGAEGQSVGAAVGVDLRLGLVGDHEGACVGRLVNKQGNQDARSGSLMSHVRGHGGGKRQAADEKREKHREDSRRRWC